MELNTLLSEELNKMPLLSGLTVWVMNTPTVVMTSFIATTSCMTMMTTKDMYKREMNSSNGSTTTDTSHMTMTTTIDMRKPDRIQKLVVGIRSS